MYFHNGLEGQVPIQNSQTPQIFISPSCLLSSLYLQLSVASRTLIGTSEDAPVQTPSTSPANGRLCPSLGPRSARSSGWSRHREYSLGKRSIQIDPIILHFVFYGQKKEKKDCCVLWQNMILICFPWQRNLKSAKNITKHDFFFNLCVGEQQSLLLGLFLHNNCIWILTFTGHQSITVSSLNLFQAKDQSLPSLCGLSSTMRIK